MLYMIKNIYIQNKQQQQEKYLDIYEYIYYKTNKNSRIRIFRN